MKILFVLPRDSNDYGHKPVGISMLSGIAKRLGHQTEFLDLGFVNHEYSMPGYEEQYTRIGMFKPVDYGKVEQEQKSTVEQATNKYLCTFHPDIVAISLFFPLEKIAREIIRATKEYDKNITIVIGGPQATTAPEKALALGTDYVNIGEGLVSWELFLRARQANKPSDTIGNFQTSGKLLPLLTDLDTLPYLDYDIYEDRHFLKAFDGKVYRGGDAMITIGCIGKCSYCINHYYRKIYRDYNIRRYSINRIVNELSFLAQRYHLEFFKFCDENFLLMPVPALQRFVEAYKSRVCLPFTTAVHPKTVTEEKISLLRQAGCVSLSIGIENGDEEYRGNVLKRSDSIKDVLNAFRLARKHHIRTMAFNMGATPFYTRKMYEDTIELNKRAEPDVSTFSLYMPLPGTELAKVAMDNGFLDPDWENKLEFNYLEKPILKFKNLTSDEIVTMRNEFQGRIKT
jgi:radical SAM superfamily enzyme YgiQ (UPF0313 family)